MRSKRSRTYSKKSPLQDTPQQIVDDQHTQNVFTNPVTLTPKTLENEIMAMSSVEQPSNSREVFLNFIRMQMVILNFRFKSLSLLIYFL